MHTPVSLEGNFIETFLAGENTMAKSRHEKEAEKQTKIIETFNEAHPIGTIVDVTKDDYSVDRTKTRSEAWFMGGHTAMIMLEGISGGYLLERVSVVEFVEATGLLLNQTNIRDKTT